MRKMEEESRKKSGRINVLDNSRGEDDRVKRNADGSLWLILLSLRGAGSFLSTDQKKKESTRKWRYGLRNGSATSVAWHRREAEAEAGVAEKMMSKTDPQRHLATRNCKGGQGQGSRQAAWWPMLDVRRATLPERVLQLGHRWTAVSHHYGVDIVATRNFSRTDPRTMELLASIAMQRKRQEKVQGKGKGGKGDKGKGKGQ